MDVFFETRCRIGHRKYLAGGESLQCQAAAVFNLMCDGRPVGKPHLQNAVCVIIGLRSASTVGHKHRPCNYVIGRVPLSLKRENSRNVTQSELDDDDYC